MRQIIEHIDLLVVKKGEKVQVDVPIVVVGEPFPGTMATQGASSVSLEVEATHIPETVEVDVDGLEDGAHITAADLTLPRGASLITEPETLIVGVSVPAATIAAADEIEAADEANAAEQSDEAEAEGDEKSE